MFLPLFLYLMTLSTVFTTIIQRRHILMTLLSLEATTLVLATSAICFIGEIRQMDILFFVVILTMGATEASLGLALLVSMARKSGLDMIKSLTMSKC